MLSVPLEYKYDLIHKLNVQKNPNLNNLDFGL